MSLKITKRGLYFTESQWSTGTEPDESQILEPGEVVEYVAHVPGGMVKVRRNGLVLIIHPGCTAELS